MDKSLLKKSTIELKNLILKKEISPVELTKLSLERIEETNSKTNTFITIIEDQALDDAKKVEKKLMKGEVLGLMAGIPTSIKDLEPVKDVKITKGSLSFKNVIADHDQICVERIKNEDGIILGKTNCSEFGHSGTGENKLGDETRNPWNLEYTSGASSGGSAVSVATSVNTVAQASDGGGSVRIPASFCGLFGMIATTGRIPRRNSGLLSWLPINYSRIGPISWYVEDSALMLQTMSGPHPMAEALTIETKPEDYLKNINISSIKNLKIGWSSDLGSRIVDEEVKNITTNKVKFFEDNGAIVEEFKFKINLEELEEPLHKHVMFALSYSTNKEYLKNNYNNLMPHVKNTILRGKEVTGEQYIKGISKLNEFRTYVDSIFRKFDFIITPTMAIKPHKCNERPFVENKKIINKKLNSFEKYESNIYDYSSWNYVLLQMTAPFNWSGNPAATLPCGFSKLGLPIGLQIIAPKFKETELLQICKFFEDQNPWHNNRPNI